jgi:hypothetical protein|tara:strand:+ start:1612 stop:2298 length:687 start_codon:yes stop_codon:yes gene_type:complete
MGLKIVVKGFNGDDRIKLKDVEDEMDDWGDWIVVKARQNLERGTPEHGSKNSTGTLSESLTYEVGQDKDQNIVMTFPMVPYGVYVEEGVKGATSSDKAPNSPFRFGSKSGAKGGLRKGIRKWINDKPIRNTKWKNKNGQFMSYDQMTFAISRSVYNKGISPFPFIEPAIEDSWIAFKKRVEVALEDDLERFFTSQLPSHKMEYVLSIPTPQTKTAQPRDSKGRFIKRT